MQELMKQRNEYEQQLATQTAQHDETVRSKLEKLTQEKDDHLNKIVTVLNNEIENRIAQLGKRAEQIRLLEVGLAP